MIRIAVCDDEEVAVAILARKINHLFAQSGAPFELVHYTDSLLLRNDIINGTPFSILFLDIDMPSLNGIQLGEHLRKAQFDGLIVFISNREEQVFNSFRVQPFRFIRKRKFNEEIGIVIKDLLRELTESEDSSVLLKNGTSMLRLNPYDIMYVESQRKHQYIHLTAETLEIHSLLSEIWDTLSDFGFIQIHKSYFVNYRFIHSINKTDVILDNKESLPVSRQRLKEVKLKFQEYSLHF